MTSEKVTLAFDKRIDSVQFLRFIGAMCITIYHFSGIWGDCPFDFSSAVYLFYMISGFVVMLSTRKEEKKKLFLTRRLIKTLPLYWGLTIFTFFAGLLLPSFLGYMPNVTQLIKSMLFIPFARVNAKGGVSYRPIVGLGHTLQMEMLFYIMFLVAMRINHKKRGFIAAAFCLVPLLFGMFFYTDNAVLHFYTSNVYSWASFIIGIAIYGLFVLIGKKNAQVEAVPLNTICVIVTLFAAVPLLIIPTHIIYRLAVFATVLCCALIFSMSKLKTPKIFVKLGDISFSYYLLHYYTVSLSAKFLGIDSFSLRNILLALVVSALTWGISWVSWYIVENKISGFLINAVTKKALSKRKKES